MSNATTFINGRPVHGCRKICDTLRKPYPVESTDTPEQREARVNLYAERVSCGLDPFTGWFLSEDEKVRG